MKIVSHISKAFITKFKVRKLRSAKLGRYGVGFVCPNQSEKIYSFGRTSNLERPKLFNMFEKNSGGVICKYGMNSISCIVLMNDQRSAIDDAL
jgi:hypothetical protein